MTQFYSHANTGSSVSIRLQPPTPAPHHLLSYASPAGYSAPCKIVSANGFTLKASLHEKREGFVFCLEQFPGSTHRSAPQTVVAACHQDVSGKESLKLTLWLRNVKEKSNTVLDISTFLRLHFLLAESKIALLWFVGSLVNICILQLAVV